MVTFRSVGPMRPRTFEPEPIPKEVAEAIGRLEAWIRNYGHLKQPEFVADLKTVIEAAKQS